MESLRNSTYPVDFLSENLRIQVNVLDAALAHGVQRLLFLGSSCIYPQLAPQPIKEKYLLTGHLEPTNDAYAIAKIAGILQIQAVRKQYGLPWISAMPTNLYGPGDNFSPQGSHVLPALIRRYDEARRDGIRTVTNWGSGSPRREFLHVEDMAKACIHLLEHYDGPEQVNVGTGEDSTIKEIAEIVADAVGFTGTTTWDTTKPDGTPQKLLDVTKLRAAGWKPKISLHAGIASTVEWYRSPRTISEDLATRGAAIRHGCNVFQSLCLTEIRISTSNVHTIRRNVRKGMREHANHGLRYGLPRCNTRSMYGGIGP